MWRSFFLALGIFLIILGGQSLVVDHVILATNRKVPAIVTGQNPNGSVAYRNSGVFSNNGYRANQVPYQSVGYSNPVSRPGSNVVRTKEWMPWSLLATGAIVVMYTLSLPVSSGSGSFSSSDD